MTTATAIQMHQPDIDDAIELFRRNVLPLKCVAWALIRWRGQVGKPLTVDELREKTGASRTAAYRAIHELTADQQSRISGLGPNRSAVPHVGTASPGKRDSQSRKAGFPVPESGTTTYERDLDQEETLSRTPAHEEPVRNLKSDRETIRRVIHGMHEDGFTTEWTTTAMRLCDDWPAWWVDELIRDEKTKLKPPKQPSYYRPRLVEWDANGGPPSQRLKATGTSGPAPRSNTPQTAEERERFVRELNEL